MANLTKTDLDQFRKIVREEVENEVQTAKVDIEARLLDTRMRVTEEVWAIGNRAKNTEIIVKRLEKAVDEVKKNTNRIEKKLDDSIIHLDNHFTKRINRLETHAKLPPLGQN